MAQEQTAETGTDTNTPKWDSYGAERYPFLNMNEEQKRAGFRVQFLIDKPRKETPSNLDEKDTDFWFDVIHDGQKYTWTISQKSLVMELQKHKPFKNKVFDVQLVPIDDEFKKQFPKYKGKDRYSLTYIETKEPETDTASASDPQPDVEVEDVE